MAASHTRGGDDSVEETPQPTPRPRTVTDVSASQRDVIIEIGEETVSTSRPASRASFPASHEGAQEVVLAYGLIGLEDEKLPNFWRRTTAFLKPTPDPLHATELRIRTLENNPNGYPRLAAFQTSDPNFGLYRSFSYLHSRILLDLQDEITELEKELDDLDWDDFDEDPSRPKHREVPDHDAKDESPRTRKTVLRDIKEKLMEYDEVLIKARELESFNRPSNRDYRSVRRYHTNEKPLMDRDMDSIRSKEDIVSIGTGRARTAFDGGLEALIEQFDGFLEYIFRLKQPPLLRFFRTRELQKKTMNTSVLLYSTTRIDKLVNVLITLVIFTLLVIPIVTMYHLTRSISLDADAPAATARNTLNAIGILILFTLLFSAAISTLTNAARHEAFAASAAYCAVLVVFIGNFTGTNN